LATKPYNPLHKINLAKSIELEILSSSVIRLEGEINLDGAGVYLIYYNGDFDHYSKIARENAASWTSPIYVGKAIPAGGRKGGIRAEDAPAGHSLQARLRKHARSIRDAKNLSEEDFSFRYVVLDDIWIPLGENILIERFKPLWNVAIDGFGNNPQGRGRVAQKRSPWDVLHPGRLAAAELTGGGPELAAVLGRVEDYFAGRKLRQLPKTLASDENGTNEDDES
jgi:hypothetical protein